MRRALVIVGNTVVDAVVGYRAWRVKVANSQSELRSVYCQEVKWLVGEPLESECKCRQRRAVYQGGERLHTCGIYAYDEPRLAAAAAPRSGYAAQFFGQQFVYGEVYLWGEVIRHETGYRAGFALPAGFYKPTPADTILARHVELAAIQYGVPLITPPVVRA